LKIYTRKGDKGSTILLTGERVKKNDARIEAYGDVDELTSYVGLIHDLTDDPIVTDFLLHIQDRLMVSAAWLAAGKPGPNLPGLTNKDILDLEEEIDTMNEQIPAIRHFILPGGYPLSSHCHIARTICRRAERHTVSIIDSEDSHLVIVLQYLNRLSDYLFVLARFFIYKNKKHENAWLSGI